MDANRSENRLEKPIDYTKINQSTQLRNALAPLRMPGVNVVSNPDGIIIAGAAVGIFLRREAKNRYHVTAIASGIKTFDKPDFSNIGEALTRCVQFIKLDETINARKG